MALYKFLYCIVLYCIVFVVFIICSVPRGSVLSLRLFILYTADLADVASAHDVNLHSYADDTQCHPQNNLQNMTITVHRLESCRVDMET